MLKDFFWSASHWAFGILCCWPSIRYLFLSVALLIKVRVHLLREILGKLCSCCSETSGLNFLRCCRLLRLSPLFLRRLTLACTQQAFCFVNVANANYLRLMENTKLLMISATCVSLRQSHREKAMAKFLPSYHTRDENLTGELLCRILPGISPEMGNYQYVFIWITHFLNSYVIFCYKIKLVFFKYF